MIKGFELLVDTKVTRVSETYAKRENISIEEAMRLFYASKTYEVLNDDETGLFLEMFEYVYDTFLYEKGVDVGWDPFD
jgi:hypothetical protein